jgi:hypothetical protein
MLISERPITSEYHPFFEDDTQYLPLSSLAWFFMACKLKTPSAYYPWAMDIQPETDIISNPEGKSRIAEI